MRPIPFARDDVLQAVAIHIHQLKGVQFGKADAVLVGNALLLGVKDDVWLEGGSFALADLFIPDQSESVRCETGDDVVHSVAVHIVSVHLRAAVRVRVEGKRVELPHRIAGQRFRLFPPAVLFHQVLAAIAIHVAHAHPVRESLVFVVR